MNIYNRSKHEFPQELEEIPGQYFQEADTARNISRINL